MKMMGIDIDAIGNHSFDRGQAYLRTQLIPLADFPMSPPNVVDPDGKLRRPSGRRRTMFKFDHGVKLGIVGFTTESTPGIVFPGNLDPFEVQPGRPGGQRRGRAARRARPTRSSRSGTRARPAARSPTRPGRSSDIADGVENVDAVIGDHNDLQVDSRCGRTACSSPRTAARASASRASGS